MGNSKSHWSTPTGSRVPPNALLYEYIAAGKEEALRLLQSAKDVKYMKDEKGATPLHIACEAGNYECVRYLLNQSFDPNCKDHAWLTPLHFAAGAGRKRCVKVLLRAGAKKDERDIWGWNPLHRAVINLHFETADILMKAGCSVNQPDENKRGVLHVAASYGHRVLLHKLIQSGADVNWQDARGRTPLHLAVVCQHFHIVDDLCRKYRCNMELPTTSNITPLSLAAQKGQEMFVRLLLDCGARCVNTRNDRGDPVPLESVLLRALNRESKKYQQYLRIAKLLLQAGGVAPSPQSFFLAIRSIQNHQLSEETHYIIHLLLVAGVRPEIQPHYSQSAEYGDVVNDLIHKYLKSSLPLKEICRRKIRRMLFKHNKNVIVASKRLVNIPRKLKEIILLEDI